MFNPIIDEHHYVGNWTYAYIFAPIGIIVVHEWLKKNNQKFLIFSWGLLSGILYLTGGINALLYVFMGISLYAALLCLIDRCELRQYISLGWLLTITGLISLLIGAYIFIPGVDTFLLSEIRLKNIDTSLLFLPQFSLIAFIKGVLSFIFPWSLSMFTTGYKYGFATSRVMISVGNYWNYLNILILPAVLVLLTNWGNLARKTKGLLIFTFAYYGLFLNPFIINPDFILKIFPFHTFSKNFTIYYICLTILIISVVQGLVSGKLRFNRKVNIFVVSFSIFYFAAAILFLTLTIFARFPAFTELLKSFNERFGHIYGGRFSNVLLLRLLINNTFRSAATVFIFFLLLARGMQIWIFRKFNHRYFYVSLVFLIMVEYACFTRIYYPFMDKSTLEFNSQKTAENKFIQNLPSGTRVSYQRAKILSQDSYRYEYDKKLFDLSIADVEKLSRERYKFDYLYNYAIPFPVHLSFFGVYNIAMERNFQEYYSRMAKGNPLYERGRKDKDAYLSSYLYNVNELSPLTKPVYAYLITQNELNAPHLTKVLKGKYYNVYKNEIALPRAYFVTRTTYEPDISKGMDMLENGKFNWEKEIVVHDKRFVVNPSSGKAGRYSIKGLKIFYNDVEVVIENSMSGILVLNDLFYPYWQAYDNGRPTALFRVNCIFRGVKLEPGRHVVKMHFQNPKLTVGLWVTLISAIGCIAGLIYVYRKRDNVSMKG